MDTAVLYARVPAPLKEAIEVHAAERGVSLTVATVDLLERGLAAISSESTVEALRREAAEKGSQLAEAKTRLSGLESSLQSVQPFVERLRQQIGTCPNCRQPVTGEALLVKGHCANCGKGLSSLLTSSPGPTGLDEKELWLLVGGLALVLVGAAYLQNRS